ASSDPDVSFRLFSNGDTTGCEFRGDVKWGDGTKSSKPFSGGTNGTALVTFDHTYKDHPSVYTIRWSSTVTSGTGCASTSGSGMFTLIMVHLAAVRFGPLTADNPGTPGLPVIKDDKLDKDGRADPVTDHQWGPQTCAALADPKAYDWLDCDSSGTPAKDWPVI